MPRFKAGSFTHTKCIKKEKQKQPNYNKRNNEKTSWEKTARPETT